MDLLLDTSAVLLFLEDSKRLPASIKTTIQSADHQCFVSIASAWEIAIKAAIGKLSIGYRVEPGLRLALMSNGIEVLPVTWEDIGRVEMLPRHHGDPFDRLLIVQAMRLGLHAVTPDEAWDDYGVSRLWA
ncbi:MAG: type II toxin-antitoxin system VapC family toxin [Verrucomicrobia bacterium]|nr:MAG: type II toxin-antitoxin system VapC family toxin [Verrucomicrobiota bacterium]